MEVKGKGEGEGSASVGKDRGGRKGGGRRKGKERRGIGEWGRRRRGDKGRAADRPRHGALAELLPRIPERGPARPGATCRRESAAPRQRARPPRRRDAAHSCALQTPRRDTVLASIDALTQDAGSGTAGRARQYEPPLYKLAPRHIDLGTPRALCPGIAAVRVNKGPAKPRRTKGHPRPSISPRS